MSASPRILVVLDGVEPSAPVLRSIGSFSGAGLLTVRDRIVASEPVIDEEMFTNAWFDERAARLQHLLTAWEAQGIAFELREIPADGTSDDALPLDLETLSNMIESAREEGGMQMDQRVTAAGIATSTLVREPEDPRRSDDRAEFLAHRHRSHSPRRAVPRRARGLAP